MRAIEAGLQFLRQNGVQYIFGIPAGSINAIYDVLFDMHELKAIVAKHENSSGYMATAYSRITGIPSVCVGSSGPGATNMITPAANAWKEKLPVIFISGCIPSTKIGKGGAQELFAESLFAPITKWSTTVYCAAEIPIVLAEAWQIAISGAPGPVHIAIPIDLQMMEIEIDTTPQLPLMEQQPIAIYNEDIRRAAELIHDVGNRGVLLLGHGAKSARSEIMSFISRTGWFVATTPRGKGAFPEDHPLSLGVYGLSGNMEAMECLNGTGHEVLMVLGSSLGELATSNWEVKLTQGKKLIHIDQDSKEFGKNYIADISVCGKVSDSLTHIISHIENQILSQDMRTLPEQMARFIKKTEYIALGTDNTSWDTLTVIRQVGACAPVNARFYIDIGEFMTYSLQNLKVKETQDFDIDINFGGMGSGISGSIGASLAQSDRPLICITGDGCFFMHGMEILTAKEYCLPILFVVINNARLGMVYHGHMLQYKRCMSDFSQNRVNISQIAASMGIRSVQVNSLRDLQPHHMQEWISHRGPMVIEINVEGNEVPPMGARVKFLQGATY